MPSAASAPDPVETHAGCFDPVEPSDDRAEHRGEHKRVEQGAGADRGQQDWETDFNSSEYTDYLARDWKVVDHVGWFHVLLVRQKACSATVKATGSCIGSGVLHQRIDLILVSVRQKHPKVHCWNDFIGGLIIKRQNGHLSFR